VIKRFYLEISSYTHQTLDNSKVLTHSVNTATCLIGGHHDHQLHLVNYLQNY